MTQTYEEQSMSNATLECLYISKAAHLIRAICGSIIAIYIGTSVQHDIFCVHWVRDVLIASHFKNRNPKFLYTYINHIHMIHIICSQNLSQ